MTVGKFLEMCEFGSSNVTVFEVKYNGHTNYGLTEVDVYNTYKDKKVLHMYAYASGYEDGTADVTVELEVE